DKHSGGKTGVELIFTELHAGGKFEEGVYKTSGGLHGVGSSVVNALSSKLIAKVYRDKEEYETEFEQEKIVTRTHKIGSTTKRGTRIQFWPDFTIFKKSKFSSEIVKEKLRESSFLIPNLKIYFTSELNNDKVIFETNEGIKEYVKYIAEGRNLIGSV
ncbi:topoisomerase IB subunit B domain protein, partial [Chlamydia psittaci 02DC14]